MEATDLSQIKQGITGKEAAKIINGNDRKLCTAINEIRDKEDINDSNVNEVNAKGGTAVNNLNASGLSITGIINQNATTKILNTINSQTNDMCHLEDDDIYQLNVSGSVLPNSNISDITIKDEDGRVLVDKFDEFVDYKCISIGKLDNLLERVAILEAKVEAKKQAEIESLPVNDTNVDGWIPSSFDDDWDYGTKESHIEPAPIELTQFQKFMKQTMKLARIAQEVINGTV